MLKFILAALLLIPSVASADDWTTADSTREAVYLALLAAYCNMTMQLARDGWNGYHEKNPILGETPSVNRVRNTCLLTAISHIGLSYVFDERPRRIFQNFSIAIEAIVVYDIYYNLGLKVKF